MDEWRKYWKNLQDDFNHLKNEELIKKQKEISLIRNGYTLLIGSGVTSSIVGTWPILLSEIAVEGLTSEIAEEDPAKYADQEKKIRSYIEENVKEIFPLDTDVLEVGEYLRYNDRDWRRNERDRELTFAYRVYHAIEYLKRERKKNAAGYDERELVDDFCKWIKDEIEFCNLTRRDISNEYRNVSEKHYAAKKLLGITEPASFTEEDLYYALNQVISSASERKDCRDVRITFNNFYSERDYSQKESKLEELTKILSPNEKLSNIIRDVAKATSDLKDKDTAFDGIDPFRLFLALLLENAAYRPSYRTLEALIKMCLEGKVGRIITYNFDTIFDELLANREVQEVMGFKDNSLTVKVYNTVDDVESVDSPDGNGSVKTDMRDIPIFHIHGILDKRYQWPLKPIIFSGTSFQYYQNDLLNSSMRCLARLLDEHWDTLCVGFSGIDANFRMLMQALKEHNTETNPIRIPKRNHVYLTRTWQDEATRLKLTETRNETDTNTAFLLTKRNLNMISNYYRHQIGVEILWWENLFDLGNALLEIDEYLSIYSETKD